MNEILGYGDEIVKHILFPVEATGGVPGLAVLSTASHIDGHPDAA